MCIRDSLCTGYQSRSRVDKWWGCHLTAFCPAGFLLVLSTLADRFRLFMGAGNSLLTLFFLLHNVHPLHACVAHTLHIYFWNFQVEDVSTDHYLIVSEIDMYTKWKKTKKPSKELQNEQVWKTYLLREESIKLLYQKILSEKLTSLERINNIEQEWLNLQQVVKQVASECLGTKRKFRKRKGLRIRSEEIEDAIKSK